MKNLTYVQRKDVEHLQQILKNFNCENCKQTEENKKNSNDAKLVVSLFGIRCSKWMLSSRVKWSNGSWRNPDTDCFEVMPICTFGCYKKTWTQRTSQFIIKYTNLCFPNSAAISNWRRIMHSIATNRCNTDSIPWEASSAQTISRCHNPSRDHWIKFRPLHKPRAFTSRTRRIFTHVDHIPFPQEQFSS